MVQQLRNVSIFNPTGREHNLSERAIVSIGSKLPHYVELRTSALLDFLVRKFPEYNRRVISNWLTIRIRPGFYQEFDEHLHLAYADQRDGHGTQHWWTLFFDDFVNRLVLENIKIQINSVKNRVSENNSNASHQWGGLHFRSKTEVRIAHALHSKNVLFFANSSGFLDLNNLDISNADNRTRQKVEVDFLIFYKQKCMILEVDGEHHQQTSQATRDYMRDRVLLRDGIPTVRFTANECYNRPLDVVGEFLNLF